MYKISQYKDLNVGPDLPHRDSEPRQEEPTQTNGDY